MGGVILGDCPGRSDSVLPIDRHDILVILLHTQRAVARSKPCPTYILTQT